MLLLSDYVNMFHLAQGVAFVLLALAAPVPWLPIVIGAIVYQLARMNDYCVLSELAEVARDWQGGQGRRYGQQVSEWLGSAGLGDIKANSIMSQTALGATALIALLRLSLALGLRPTGRALPAFFAFMLLVALSGEALVHVHSLSKE